MLHALGQASAYEVDEAGSGAAWRPSAELALTDAHAETLRQLARECAEALAAAVEATPETRPAPTATAFGAAQARAEAELAAPALVGLPAAEVGALMRLLASVLLDPDSVHGDGRRVNALSSAIGRRLRKRAKKLLEDTSLRSVSETDFAAWQSDLRAMAAASVLASGGSDLRSALIALVSEDGGGPLLEAREGDDIGARVAASPLAQALLRRIVRGWLGRFGDAR
jgi:hypothetical protein